MSRHIQILIFCLAALLCGCNNRAARHNATHIAYEPRYAESFRILADSAYRYSRIIEVTNPWQGATDVCTQTFLEIAGEHAPADFDGQRVAVPVNRVAVLSSSFVAMFDALGEADRISGVSGLDYIMNPAVRRATSEGRVVEIGYESNIDFEALRATGTDLILLYGISGEDSTLTAKLRELGIPYMYIGDYIESSPLGKAEWVVAIAALCNKQAEGERIFAEIEQRYDAVRRQLADKGDHRPRVMLNTPYRDTWFMPSTRSYAVRLIEDAGGEYVYPANTGNSSVPVSLEQALLLAASADVWLNVGQCATLDELRRTNPQFADVKAVRTHRVYNNNKRTTPTGGSDFWESGAVAPDVVLRDIALILHGRPTADSLYYYKRLE
ncbi:MAG: ABC transporter substrate-binding protein [Alistipes sp.]